MSLLFGLIAWIVLSGVCAAAAEARGRSGVAFFSLSFFFSPLIGFLAVIAMPNRTRELERARELLISRQCPHCTEWVKKDARLCRFCGHDLPPLPVPAPIAPPTPSFAAVPISMFLISLIAVGGSVYLMTPAEAPQSTPARGVVMPSDQPSATIGRQVVMAANNLQDEWKEFQAGKRKLPPSMQRFHEALTSLRSIPANHEYYVEASTALRALSAIENAVLLANQKSSAPPR